MRAICNIMFPFLALAVATGPVRATAAQEGEPRPGATDGVRAIAVDVSSSMGGKNVRGEGDARPAPAALPPDHPVSPRLATRLPAVTPQPMPRTGMSPSTSMR